MNGKYRIIKNLNQRQLLFSIQFQCKCTVDIALHISCDTVARESLKKGREKKYYKWPPLWGSVGGFHLVIKWTATEFLETFSTVLRYLEDIFEEFRIYPSRKKVFWNFFSFLFFFAFFFFLKKFASENVWITLARC